MNVNVDQPALPLRRSPLLDRADLPPLLRSILVNPDYVLMRGLARFAWVRALVAFAKRALGRRRAEARRKTLLSRMDESIFPGVALEPFMTKLKENGLGFGLALPPTEVDEIKAFAATNPVYAFRNPKWGFAPQELKAAEAALGKEILLAQYFNAQPNCAAIGRIANDPLLNLIALNYLGCVPQYLGAVLWWTYPVTPNRADQMKHAHFFHRDVDDFKFLKFFFYLTDVAPKDGGHWAVAGSNKQAPHVRFKDRFVTRRFEDTEVETFYGKERVLEVVGPQGMGFAEDTLCVHKAATPVKAPRLVLQLQFGLYKFVKENDVRPPEQLSDLIPATKPKAAVDRIS